MLVEHEPNPDTRAAYTVGERHAVGSGGGTVVGIVGWRSRVPARYEYNTHTHVVSGIVSAVDIMTNTHTHTQVATARQADAHLRWPLSIVGSGTHY